MNKEQNRLEWKERVDNFKSSKLSMAQWCKKNGYKVYQLQYWSEKYRDNQSESSKWISVNLTKPDPIIPIKITIGKCIIELEPGFNPNQLIEVIKALNSLW